MLTTGSPFSVGRPTIPITAFWNEGCPFLTQRWFEMRTLTVFCLSVVVLNAANTIQASIYSGAPILLDQIISSLFLMMPASLMVAAVHFWYRRRDLHRINTLRHDAIQRNATDRDRHTNHDKQSG